MRIISFLQARFESIEIELKAKNGSISEQEYEEKVKEAFRQLNIIIREEV